MRVNEVIPPNIDENEIMEGRLKDLAMTGIATASLAGAVHNAHKFDDTHDGPAPKNTTTYSIELPKAQTSPYVEPEMRYDAEDEYDGTEDSLRDVARSIAKKYRVSEDLVNDIVILAHKYEDEEFPKAIDILAVIAVESSFNPQAVSQLRRDPARGLMQVRPGVWGLDVSDLDNIENQIRIGSEILKRYYVRTKNPESALQAYNVGITNYRKGVKNPRYLQKVNTVRQYLASVMTRS
jgi:soluble lytic murein transglycosylase-like protein